MSDFEINNNGNALRVDDPENGCAHNHYEDDDAEFEPSSELGRAVVQYLIGIIAEGEGEDKGQENDA